MIPTYMGGTATVPQTANEVCHFLHSDLKSLSLTTAMSCRGVHRTTTTTMTLLQKLTFLLHITSHYIVPHISSLVLATSNRLDPTARRRCVAQARTAAPTADADDERRTPNDDERQRRTTTSVVVRWSPLYFSIQFCAILGTNT